MIPAAFPGSNLLIGANQKEFLPLPAHYAGGVATSCWQLSPEELAEVNRTGVVWTCQLTHGAPLQAQQLYATRPPHLPDVPQG